MTLFRSFCLLGALALAGCTSMSESECRVADWYRVGLADGSGGVMQNRLADYAEDCGKIGVDPDPIAYRKGWDQGIVHYCTPYNGWAAGVQGRGSQAAVCQGQLGYEGFSRALSAGLLVHATQSRMDRNDNEIRQLQRKLDAATSDDEKRRLREQLRALDREQAALRNTLQAQRQFAP